MKTAWSSDSKYVLVEKGKYTFHEMPINTWTKKRDERLKCSFKIIPYPRSYFKNIKRKRKISETLFAKRERKEQKFVLLFQKLVSKETNLSKLTKIMRLSKELSIIIWRCWLISPIKMYNGYSYRIKSECNFYTWQSYLSEVSVKVHKMRKC